MSAPTAPGSAREALAAEQGTNPRVVVDSAQPISSLITRFQHGVPTVTRLDNATTSRDGLVRELVQALDRRDTSALARLFVTRAEFAWLYFPTSALARPPYEIDPAFAWFQLSSESEKGIHKALGRIGGSGAAYVSSTCDPAPSVDGATTLWSACVVRWRGRDGRETAASLFATIIEHDGRFKFFSYANRL